MRRGGIWIAGRGPRSCPQGGVCKAGSARRGNIWHNAQYIAFVWLYNNNKFKSGTDPAAEFLSTISQDGNLWRYLLVCVAISTLAYLAIGSLIAAVVAPILVYQTINFHHYIVDSLIWKVRKKPLQETMGITS